MPTATHHGTATACPIHRGAIVDPAALTVLISRLLADRLPASAHPVVVFTTPVLSDARHHTTAVGALQILRPHSVLAIDSVKAIALDSGADLSEPLLVVDIGAHLSEVALLTDGTVTAACRGTMGTSDLATSSPAELVTAVTTMITKMLRDHPQPQLVDALDRGPLLAGGGALHPELTHQLAARLHSPVQPVPRPHTAAVRGAARAARSAQHHPALSISPFAPHA
ncbi:rod shape-determining protein [Streptomyces sp. HC307]|uniref:rod shape-determining protein n=1 Tax=Streptomyces flavusporus TaxID=3385496 RepID=UPI0039175D01